jgi:glycine/D-amino acid oxidase-like deaminating enzyme
MYLLEWWRPVPGVVASGASAGPACSEDAVTLVRACSNFVPRLGGEDVVVVTAFWGLRPMPRDKLPIVGKV